MNSKTEVDNAGFSGHVVYEAYRDGKLLWREEGKNIIPNVGLTHLLKVAVTQEVAAAALYVGLYNGITPVATTTMAAMGPAEVINYTNVALRPTYVGVEDGAQKATNVANVATYTIGVGGATVAGAFLATSSTWNETLSTLLAAKAFAAPKVLIEADVLNVTYEISAATV